jgi:hypothetical protein
MGRTEFSILPTDNQSEVEGTAIFTKFFLMEKESGNCFPAVTQNSCGEIRYYMGRTILDKYNQEIVTGEMASTCNLEDAQEHVKTLIK